MNVKRTVFVSISAVLILTVAGFFFTEEIGWNKKRDTRKAGQVTESRGEEIPLLSLGGVDGFGDLASQYLKSSEHVYFNGRKISEADPTSFEVLKGSLKPMKGSIEYTYARDNSKVYYKGNLLRGPLLFEMPQDPSPQTFRPLENGEYIHSYGTDGTLVYFRDNFISGADPATFEILWSPAYEGCNKTPYSKDAQGVYFSRLEPESGRPNIETVSGADPRSFEALINGYGKDKRGYYKGAEYVAPTLDLKELECSYG